jgi:hypothetical protein
MKMKINILRTIMGVMAVGIGCGVYAANDAGVLYAGTAKVDITPQIGINMCGFAGRAGAVGVHDPLFARVVVLKENNLSVAIVSSDLVWLHSGRIIDEAKKKWQIDHVILCGTHTHSGPMDTPGPWYSSMEEKVISAIGDASKNLFPAHIGAEKAPFESDFLSYNRRFIQADGKVSMWWENPSRKPNGPVDPTLRVIRIDDDSGTTRAVMVHYAAHPVVLGGKNVQISADYPGATVNYIDQEMGGKVMTMFFQGGGGDVHPYETGLSGEHGFEIVRQTGVSLGKQALLMAKGIRPMREKGGDSIKVAQSVISMAYREDKTKIVDVGVMAVLINKDIALAVISGEPFVQHQLDLSAKSPVKNTFLLGYAFFGKGIPLPTYLPSMQAVKDGGYGAGPGSANFLEAGAGERMIDEAVKLINELQGKKG